MTLDEKFAAALGIVERAGAIGLRYFSDRDALKIDQKGHQDFVSQADKDVELAIRRELGKTFPDDGIVGEEHDRKTGSSGFTWVIDPIDGTTNFINGIPGWTVVLAGVTAGQTVIGIIHDPNHSETYAARRGGGATLNGRALRLSPGRRMNEGTIGVGYSGRRSNEGIRNLVSSLLDEGSMFYRNASGALSLAYVADGRLLGYAEEHMNAWDCIAGQLIVAEAGGHVEDQDADDMIANGGRVIVAAPGVYDDLLRISDAAFGRRS